MILAAFLGKIIGFPRSRRMRFKLRSLPASQRELVKKLDVTSRAAGNWRLDYETPEAAAMIATPYFERRAVLIEVCETAGVPRKFIDYFSEIYR